MRSMLVLLRKIVQNLLLIKADLKIVPCGARVISRVTKVAAIFNSLDRKKPD